MGVKKLKFAPKSTASKNGIKDNSSPVATAMAMGVMMIAVALLLMIPLMSIVTKNMSPIINILD